MASYQAPGKSLVALLLTQIESVDDKVLSPAARRCLVDYARHLERKGLAREGDHLLAGLLLNAVEIALYLPTGKAGKGSVELTRLQERIERTQTAAKRAERRERRGADVRDGWREGRRPPPTRVEPRRYPDDADEEPEQDEGEGTDAA